MIKGRLPAGFSQIINIIIYLYIGIRYVIIVLILYTFYTKRFCPEYDLSKGEIGVFTEELTAIREAEQQADSIRKSIKIEAKRMIEAANAQAEKLLDEQEAKAKETYDSLIAEGMREADADYKAAMEKARQDAEAVAAEAVKNKEAVIDFIVERIVGAGGNH